jgi:hypothetical protein
MTKLAIETRLGSLNSYELPSGVYNANKLGLTNLIKQYNGVTNKDKFAGPLPVGVFRPLTTSIGIPGIYPWAMRWSDNEDWVFLSDNSAAAATRRIQMLKFYRNSSEFAFVGAITLTFPPATVHTIRAFRMDYQKYDTGTAAVNGTAVTGTDTLWTTDRLAVGARIGFGSKEPTEITNWYDISNIGSNTAITLSSNAGIISDGDYVIEELRAIVGTTNATATNGGLFLAKGLNPRSFTAGPNVIPAATNVDNIQAVYWLKDAATVTNTACIGFGLDDKADWQTQNLYVMDNITNHVIYKFNIRAGLTVASGASTNAFTFKTGVSGASIGTTNQTNNGRLATVSHGPARGIKCFYYTTTTRIYRTINVDDITEGSTTFVSDAIIESPPGTVNTFALTNTMNSIDYSEQLDRFIISTSNKQYLIRYLTDGTMFDRVFTSNNTQMNQAIADPSITPFPVSTLAYFSCWTVGGILYLAGIGTTAITNIVYAIPLAADWEFAELTGERLIFPKFSTLDASSFVRAYVNDVNILGGDRGSITNLGMNPDASRLYYRTQGIDDNTGSWSELDGSGDMRNIPAANEIQFSLVFKTISATCIPSRVTGVCLVYEDGSTDMHYQPSVGKSNVGDVYFAWRHSIAFGSDVPRLKVRLYDAVNGALLTEDDSLVQNGVWEKTIDDGANWVTYDSDDKGNETTYIRFRPVSLGNNIKVKAQLSLY